MQLSNEPEKVQCQIISTSFSNTVKQLFEQEKILVFIMATGIVVRSIAPLLQHKSKDPAILVMDEKGNFVISFLSGHLGDANKYTHLLASVIGATPVITTSSDLNNVKAVDLFARDAGCYLTDYNAAKLVTSCLIEDEPVLVWTDVEGYEKYSFLVEDPKGIIMISYKKPEIERIIHKESVPEDIKVVWLIPKRVIVGIGCRRNKSMEEIQKVVEAALEQIQRPMESIVKVVSIDIKANEDGILQLANRLMVEFEWFSSEQLTSVEHLFSGSEFVKKTVGVSNVSETAGYLGSNKGKCLLQVQKSNGITVSLWENEIDE